MGQFIFYNRQFDDDIKKARLFRTRLLKRDEYRY